MTNEIKTTVITSKQAKDEGVYPWSITENDCEFHGFIPGYICGFCVEFKDETTGKYDYGSCTFTNDFEEIRNPEVCDEYNDLGVSVASTRYAHPSMKPTGRLVFRGYFTEDYDIEERDFYYIDSSKEVIEAWNRYVVKEEA